jgi:phytoene dehydrogenase-like protein
MPAPSVPPTYDAVVVGSGPNGLSAAITLAEAGRSVLVLEAAATAGGGLRTEELTLPGFRHDVFSAVHPAAAASPVFARWPLERHGLRWVHPELAAVHPVEGGRGGVLARDPHVTAASLDALAPGDGERWLGFALPWLEHFRALRDTMLAGFPPVKGPLELVGRFGVDGSLEFARLLLLAARDLTDELFTSEGSAAWLWGAAMHSDVPPDGAGSAIAGVYLQLLGHAVGWPSPEGGAGALADALVAHLRASGGELRTGARVEGLVARGGRVRGVRVAGHGEIAARQVLCDTSPQALLALAGDALPDAYARRLARFRSGPSTVKLDWALGGPAPWVAPDARRAGTVHVGGDARAILETLEAARGHRSAERPFLLFGQQSVADPTRAPAGRHTAWAYTHVPPGIDWAVEAPRQVERMEAQVEAFAPGFRDQILARHLLLPGDLECRDANLRGGDVGGGSYALDQLVFRPVPSLSPYRTALRGLYLCSASTFPGGAVHGVPGRAAARAAIWDARLRR